MPNPPRQSTRPTFGWDKLSGARAAGLPAVDELPHTRLLTSGRAALFAAMRALGVQPGDTALARRLYGLPRGRIVARRRAHYELLFRLTQDLPGARPLFGPLPAQAAPYALPLWVDAPEPVYSALRAAGCAVFRWDRVWPGVPDFPGDHGARWRRHVLQLLCHQDLCEPMLARTCALLRQHLSP